MKLPDGVLSSFVNVHGIKTHYVEAGNGEPIGSIAAAMGLDRSPAQMAGMRKLQAYDGTPEAMRGFMEFIVNALAFFGAPVAATV